jgi:hypothetical protein
LARRGALLLASGRVFGRWGPLLCFPAPYLAPGLPGA